MKAFFPSFPGILSLNRVELTIEANPEGLTFEKLSGYKEVGFNRLSLGVQSLSNRGLRFLSRVHDAKTALKALEMGAKVFENLSVDLIYGYLGSRGKNPFKRVEPAFKFSGKAHFPL
jgi:oxygen-independent coproporphyrinogen-3 oxidase